MLLPGRPVSPSLPEIAHVCRKLPPLTTVSAAGHWLGKCHGMGLAKGWSGGERSCWGPRGWGRASSGSGEEPTASTTGETKASPAFATQTLQTAGSGVQPALRGSRHRHPRQSQPQPEVSRHHHKASEFLPQAENDTSRLERVRTALTRGDAPSCWSGSCSKTVRPAEPARGIWGQFAPILTSLQVLPALSPSFCASFLQVICAPGLAFCLASLTYLPGEQHQQTGLCPVRPIPCSWGEGPSLGARTRSRDRTEATITAHPSSQLSPELRAAPQTSTFPLLP